ncbi:MAG: trigger factor [Rhodospirillales bacterium]|jgi:trigger factor
MQVTELTNAGLKREFEVVVPAATIADSVAARLAEIGKDAALPGFRPGKVPLAVLRKRFGQAVMGEVLERTVSDASAQALQDRGLRPAMQPQVQVTSFGEDADLVYKIAFEVLPDVAPGDLKSLELRKVKIQVVDGDIDKALARMAEQRGKAKAEPADRPAQRGDIVVIDFLGKIDGTPFAGGAASDHRLELGSGTFIPGFEDQLIGQGAGAQLVVAVPFPETYPNADLRGKPAEFDVTVKQVLAPSTIPVDEAMAKEIGFEDLETLRGAIKDQIAREFAEMARLRTKRQLLDKLAAQHGFEVPGGMVEIELQAIMANVERERSMGMEDDSTRGKSPEELGTEFRPIAERRVRLGLLLSEIGRANNIEVTQEETNRALVEQARRYPGQERKVIEQFRANPEMLAQIRGPLFEDKVIDFIMEMANTTEVAMTVEELQQAQAEDDKPAA